MRAIDRADPVRSQIDALAGDAGVVPELTAGVAAARAGGVGRAGEAAARPRGGAGGGEVAAVEAGAAVVVGLAGLQAERLLPGLGAVGWGGHAEVGAGLSGA